MKIAAEKEQSGQKFDDEIARRYGLVAGTAFSAKKQPAHYGKIVVKRDHVSAMGTGGTRLHHRLAQRQPVDAHVQEAAEAQPVGKDRNCEKDFHVDRVWLSA